METLSIYIPKVKKAEFLWSSYVILIILFLRIAMSLYLFIWFWQLFVILNIFFFSSFILTMNRSKYGAQLALIAALVDILIEIIIFGDQIPLILFGNLMDIPLIIAGIFEYFSILKYTQEYVKNEEEKNKKFLTLVSGPQNGI